PRRRPAGNRLPRGDDRSVRTHLLLGARLMARIKDTSVEAVKSAAEILPLVEDYVRLRKAGGTYKGLCPFHQEKTPSFTVSPARGTFKCFGCGEGGDAIAFVEQMEQVDFVGAIESLAGPFGVPRGREDSAPE